MRGRWGNRSRAEGVWRVDPEQDSGWQVPCLFVSSFLNGIITSIGGCVHLDNRLVMNEGNLLSQG